MAVKKAPPAKSMKNIRLAVHTKRMTTDAAEEMRSMGMPKGKMGKKGSR